MLDHMILIDYFLLKTVLFSWRKEMVSLNTEIFVQMKSEVSVFFAFWFFEIPNFHHNIHYLLHNDLQVDIVMKQDMPTKLIIDQ
jgi:hypothetical protein